MDELEREFWGTCLRRWPESALAESGLDGDDRVYLADVGLPTGVDLSLEVVDPTQPRQATPGYLVLAHNWAVPICVRLDTGQVVTIEDAGERMVSSSVRSFGRCLMFYEDYRRRVRAHR
jgi:hypothetical protein